MKFFKRYGSIILLVSLFVFGGMFLLEKYKTPKANNIAEYKFFSLHQENWKSKRVNQFVNDINYTATEVPIQYYLLKNNPDDSAKIDSLYQINAKERIIEIEFQHVNEADLLLEDYTKRNYDDAVKYMAFTIEKDFTVVTSSNDTIPCSGVNFERNFKIAPFKRALLYFNNINPSDKIKLIYQDYLFGNGIIKFNLTDIPLKV
ncbi:hypothetical protein QLS71_007960 [Mariniflexile litorale]|uniref:Uncharacterized protein n=1 Tax=Mariniflexile litorale TaxID=3045158 RepID=A0AAU7EL48_9FLAO|nr:hypothetical protein [Mariniflexile sp. KMM 9835]MDQ8213267.1 hypothetical protein [Mariniflexile sp. KMM 9835]